MKRSGDLTEGVVWKRLFMFFIPIAVGTLIQQLYNAVDGFIVSKFVGTEALAAVGGSTAQIINVLIGFFVSITSGASVIIAQIFGAGRDENVNKATGSAVKFCAIIGVVVMVFGLIFTPWMLELLKTPEDTIADAITYLRIYFLGVPFIMILNMESNLLRAVGDSTSPFYYMIAGCGSNIVLDFVFVVFFHWDVAGVAIATVIAQIVNMALLTFNLVRTKESYKLNIRDFNIDWRYIGAMMRIGVPSGLQSLMYSVSNAIIQVSVNLLGTTVVASWAMTGKTDGFYWAITSAFGTAVTAFIGQNLGAGRKDRNKDCVKQGLIMAVLMAVGMSVLLLASGIPVLRLLSDDAEVVETSYRMMVYMVPFYFIWSFIEVISAVLKGSGDAVNPVIIIGIGICLFRIIWMKTVFAYYSNVLSLCLSYDVSWFITAIALVIYYKVGKWDKSSGRIIDK